jgi:hypothetical protein
VDQVTQVALVDQALHVLVGDHVGRHWRGSQTHRANAA